VDLRRIVGRFGHPLDQRAIFAHGWEDAPAARGIAESGVERRRHGTSSGGNGAP